MEHKRTHSCIKCGRQRDISRQVLWQIRVGKIPGVCRSCSQKGTRMGERNSPQTEFRKGMVPWNKGIISDVKPWLGKKRDQNTIAKIRLSMVGKHAGPSHWNWQGGITSDNRKIRHSFAMNEWRRSVFLRDKFTCRGCGEKGGRLEADHIKPFSLFPELRFDLDNGRTLCKACHNKLGWKLSKETLISRT